MDYIIRSDSKLLDFAQTEKKAKKKIRKHYSQYENLVVEKFEKFVGDILMEELRQHANT